MDFIENNHVFPSSCITMEAKGTVREEGLYGFDVFDTSFPKESLETCRRSSIMMSKNMGFILAFLL